MPSSYIQSELPIKTEPNPLLGCSSPPSSVQNHHVKKVMRCWKPWARHSLPLVKLFNHLIGKPLTYNIDISKSLHLKCRTFAGFFIQKWAEHTHCLSCQSPFGTYQANCRQRKRERKILCEVSMMLIGNDQYCAASSVTRYIWFHFLPNRLKHTLKCMHNVYML